MAVLSVPVEEIRREARALDPVKVLLTILFALPFALGWLIGALWTVIAWAWTAGVVGFRAASGRTPDRAPQDREERR